MKCFSNKNHMYISLINYLIIELFNHLTTKSKMSFNICTEVNTSSVMECPICMETICNNKNIVVTECGHTFHTSCLMKNIAVNGFDCPMCRHSMAEIPEDSDDDDETLVSEDDDSSTSTDEWEENQRESYLDDAQYDVALQGVRIMFRNAQEEEEEEEELSSLGTLDEPEELIPQERPEENTLRSSIFSKFLQGKNISLEELTRGFMVASVTNVFEVMPMTYLDSYYKIAYLMKECFSKEINVVDPLDGAELFRLVDYENHMRMRNNNSSNVNRNLIQEFEAVV